MKWLNTQQILFCFFALGPPWPQMTREVSDRLLLSADPETETCNRIRVIWKGFALTTYKESEVKYVAVNLLLFQTKFTNTFFILFVY